MMKIGHLEPKAAVTSVGHERKSQSGSGAAPAEAESSTQVQLSATASLLSSAATDPSFDQAKVDRIAKAIREGKFEINPEAIADKLISNAQELLSAKTSH